MRSPTGTRLISCALATASMAVAACDGDTVSVPGREGAVKSVADVRAERRAYDGAPPTVPHESFGMTCSACHNAQGQSVTGVGFAPASPHESTSKAGNTTRCRQCHVFVTTDGLFVSSEFVGLGQDLSAGGRATPGAPQTIPHRTLMRENCIACHDGPGAREEIRTSHPERRRCRQCHVPVTTRGSFESALGEGLEG
jgi:cytochrome c-type protein NapB